jgi:hypothetical protein
MERLFSPCTRLNDILESQGRLEQFRGRHPDVGLQELNLNVSTEELLSAERVFTYADLYATIGNEDTVAWLKPHTAIVREGGRALHAWNQLDESCGFRFSADGKEIIAMALSREHLLEICDCVLRLLAVSVVHSLLIDTWSSLDAAVINATTLAYLMEQCQSLKVLTLYNLDMDEDSIRVLGGYSRPGLEIVLVCCKITSAGAGALAEVLGRNQGPTELELCTIDNSVLADGLRGNSRLKYLRPRLSGNGDEDSNRQVLAIAGALRENKGLVELNLTCYGPKMNDEAWGAICNSLKAHPTLEVLNLRGAFRNTAPALVVLKSRVQALVDMLQVNMSIHTIHLDTCYCQHELYRGSVIPYLETNRLRPYILAIQRARPIPYRAKVLGRALLAVRSDANRFWMLLSGNAEVAFPSGTSIAAAANLPKPAAAATTTVTGSLPIAAAAASTATSAATPSTAYTSDVFASTVAANAATPSASQDRKARR